MKDKAYLTEFVKNIFDDNFSAANANLTNCVNEKIKAKMKTYMVEKQYVSEAKEESESDGNEDKGSFYERMKKYRKGGKDKKAKDKSNKPKRGGKRD